MDNGVDEALLTAGGLRFELNGPVATITLDRPGTKNSQTPATWLALRAIGAWLGSEPGSEPSPDPDLELGSEPGVETGPEPGTGVRVVVIRGAGDAFSSGLDRRMLDPAGNGTETSVLALLEQSDDELAAGIATWQEGFTWLRRPDIISVAAVRGAAVGAGFQLALACDLRVLADDARFSMREPSLGLVPDLTGTKPLVDLVGYSRALEICATTRLVSADEAREIGLATIVVPSAELDEAVADLVAALTAPVHGAVSETKALLHSASRLDLEEQRLAERNAQVRRFRALAASMT